jgi:hypothetical protein
MPSLFHTQEHAEKTHSGTFRSRVQVVVGDSERVSLMRSVRSSLKKELLSMIGRPLGYLALLLALGLEVEALRLSRGEHC